MYYGFQIGHYIPDDQVVIGKLPAGNKPRGLTVDVSLEAMVKTYNFTVERNVFFLCYFLFINER